MIIGLSVYLFTRETDRTLYELPNLPELSKKEITRIEIGNHDKTVVLTKADEEWRIGEQQYPASKSKVNDMLDTLENLTLSALVSETGDTVRYDLTAENKIGVKAWAGQTLARDLDIGKPAASFRHTFIKLAGDPKIYQARDNFRSKFEQSAEQLRDKTVMRFSVTDIEEIELKRGKEALRLVRKEVPLKDDPAAKKQEPAKAEEPSLKAEMAWQTQDGRTADPAKIDRFLNTLSQLECDAYIAGKTKADFSDPVYSIRVKGLQPHTLSLYAKAKEEETTRPAVSSGNDDPFTLPDWKAQGLMPDFKELLADNP